MARRRGASSSAARSAAAKKGWETRRRGGAAKTAKTKASKPAATAPTKPSKPRATAAKPAAAKPKAPPKTTTARGRARTNATAARQKLKSGGGTKAAKSLATAKRAADFYKATNSGKKRSPNRSAGAAPAKATATKAAAKPSRSKSGAKPAARTTGKRPNLKAQRAKEMASRTGVVPGSKFQDGQAQRTLSLREMRTAVRQRARQVGIKTASDFRQTFALGSGVSTKAASGLETGRMPRTRSDWEKIYRSTVRVPMSDRNLKARPGVVNGIDIHNNFRPHIALGLKAGASEAQINQAFRSVARRNHPDAGGRSRDFQRLLVMRDSLISTARALNPKTTKAKRSKKGSSTPSPRQSGPRLLPAAGGTGMSGSKPRKSRKR